MKVVNDMYLDIFISGSLIFSRWQVLLKKLQHFPQKKMYLPTQLKKKKMHGHTGDFKDFLKFF